MQLADRWSSAAGCLAYDLGCQQPIDSSNVPLDSVLFPNVLHCSPTANCVDGEGSPVLHTAEVQYVAVRVETGLESTTEPEVLWGSCDLCFSVGDSIYFEDGFPPGAFRVKHRYQGVAGSNKSWESDGELVFLTRPDVTELIAFELDVVNEKPEAGSVNTADFTIRNYGESGAQSPLAFLYMAKDEGMTLDLELVAVFALDAVEGGALRSDSRTFVMPDYVGDRYFAVSCETPGQAHHVVHSFGQKDLIRMRADLDFVPNVVTWIQPEGQGSTPLTVPYGSMVQFQFSYENKGEASSLAATSAQLEIRKGNGGPWTPVLDARFELGAVPHSSGAITSPIFSASVTGALAGVDDVGKKRALRLRMVDGGAEKKINNNKSAFKKIVIADGPPFLWTMPSSVTAGDDVTVSVDGGSAGAT